MRCKRDLEIFFAAQNVAAKLGVKLPGRSHHQRPGGTVQQFHSQSALQFLHMLARGGLADTVHRSAPAEAASLSNIPEKL